MEERKIYVETENGEKIEGEVLFTFEANGDNFILYELEGHDEVYAGKFDEEGNLKQVEEDEWKVVEKVYNEYIDSLEEEEDER